MPKETQEPRRIILDELIFEVKIPANMDRELVKKLVARTTAEDEGFTENVRNYLQTQLTQGICDKEDVTITTPNTPKTL